jgi:hypothetical protein
VRLATVALPGDLVLMSGHGDGIMRYDKDTDRFVALAPSPLQGEGRGEGES